MMMKIILCVSVLPVLLIMYFVLRGMTKERNGTLFGVALWQDALKDDRVEKVIQKYKKQLNCLALFFVLLQIPIYLVEYSSVIMILWMLWLFSVIVFIYTPYAKANKKMRAIKAEYRIEHNEGQQNYTYVDVTAAAAEKPKYFQKSTIIACVAGFVPAVLAVILNKRIDNQSAPELWVTEVVLLSMALVGLVCLWALHYYNRQQITVYTMDSEVNIQIARVKKYQWSRCFCFLAWTSVIFNALVLAGFYLDGEYMVAFIMITCVLYGIIPIVLIAVSCSVVEKQRKKLLEGREPLVSEDDSNWIWGIFYYNRNDKRFLVDNRMGTGSAINMAHRAAVIFNGFIIALVLLTVVGTGVIMALEEFTPIKLEYEGELLVAEHWKEEYCISKEDIVSVTLLEELPRMSKSSGTGMENVYKGKWFSREYNKRFKVCLNPQELPVIMVETKDGTWYLLGDGESERTEEIYQELIGEK